MRKARSNNGNHVWEIILWWKCWHITIGWIIYLFIYQILIQHLSGNVGFQRWIRYGPCVVILKLIIYLGKICTRKTKITIIHQAKYNVSWLGSDNENQRSLRKEIPWKSISRATMRFSGRQWREFWWEGKFCMWACIYTYMHLKIRENLQK